MEFDFNLISTRWPKFLNWTRVKLLKINDKLIIFKIIKNKFTIILINYKIIFTYNND